MKLPSNFAGITFFAVLIFPITTAGQNETCYFPDGSVARYNDELYLPCKIISPGGVTFCCYRTDACTEAGYCAGDAGIFYRGGCTDQTWTSSLCPEICAKGAISTKHIYIYHTLRTLLTNFLSVDTLGFAAFYSCNAGQFAQDNWTCGGMGCDPSVTFSFKPGRLFVPPLAASTATITTTVSGAVTAATATVAAQPDTNSCPSNNGAVTGVGAGLGIALGLAILAGLSGFLYEHRKRKAAEKRISNYGQGGLISDSKFPVAQEAGSGMVHELGPSYRSQL